MTLQDELRSLAIKAAFEGFGAYGEAMEEAAERIRALEDALRELIGWIDLHPGMSGQPRLKEIYPKASAALAHKDKT